MPNVPPPKIPYWDGAPGDVGVITPDFMLATGQGIDIAVLLQDSDGEPEDLVKALREAADYVEGTPYGDFWDKHGHSLVSVETGNVLVTWKEEPR